MTKIKLCLSGSGTRFPVFAGALKRLELEGLVPIDGVATSGGSIVLAAAGSGKTANEIINLCREVMPRLNKLVSFSFIRLFQSWGLVNGNKIKEEFKKHFPEKLKDSKFPINLVSVNFDTENLEIFNKKTHPDLDTVRAVMASIALPIVFVPEIINGDMYIDGGVKANFAIDYYGDKPNVVGLYFCDGKGRKPRPKGSTALVSFIFRVISMLISAKTETDIAAAANAVQIPLKTSINGLDFSFTQQQIGQMIKEGFDCVDEYIKSNPERIAKLKSLG